MLSPAVICVTPSFLTVTVYVVPSAGVDVVISVEIPVPPAMSTIWLCKTVDGFGAPPEASACILQFKYVPVGTFHVLSPLKNVVPSSVPAADKSIVPIVTAPVAFVFAVPAEINLPFAFVNVLTPSVFAVKGTQLLASL